MSITPDTRPPLTPRTRGGPGSPGPGHTRPRGGAVGRLACFPEDAPHTLPGQSHRLSPRDPSCFRAPPAPRLRGDVCRVLARPVLPGSGSPARLVVRTAGRRASCFAFSQFSCPLDWTPSLASEPADSSHPDGNRSPLDSCHLLPSLLQKLRIWSLYLSCYCF